MVTSQQNHDIESLNGDLLGHSVCKAQVLVDATCNFNDTFKTEENFTNPWQQSRAINEENEFSHETQRSFNDEE